MARMHSRRRGKSGSNKPVKQGVPAWVSYKAKDVEMLITKLAKEEKTAAQIGVILRDSYGIPSVKAICNKSVSDIVKVAKLAPELPDDLTALLKRLAALHKHLEENRQDETAKRGRTLTESKINRLVKYYKKVGVLAQDWKVDKTRLGFYAE